MFSNFFRSIFILNAKEIHRQAQLLLGTGRDSHASLHVVIHTRKVRTV